MSVWWTRSARPSVVFLATSIALGYNIDLQYWPTRLTTILTYNILKMRPNYLCPRVVINLLSPTRGSNTSRITNSLSLFSLLNHTLNFHNWRLICVLQLYFNNCHLFFVKARFGSILKKKEGKCQNHSLHGYLFLFLSFYQ